MRINLIVIFFFISIFCVSQENSPSFLNNNSSPKDFNNFQERIFFGGNVGAWFGRTTYVNISPVVGIKITKKFSAGVGATYNYFSEQYGNQKFIYTVYGGSVFARYLIMENLFAQVGVDRLSVPDYRTGLLNSRTWIDNVLIGGGYRQRFSERGSFMLVVFYNINETPLSPYTNPIVQMGFNIGF
jgi:hypothetical protein